MARSLKSDILPYDHLMTRVLLAEDDPAISEPLARALRREGYDVDVRADGRAALDAAAENPDLVVLDLGLPHVDAWNVWWTDYGNSVEGFAAVHARVRDAAVEAGRAPGDIEATAAVRKRSTRTGRS